MNEIMTLEEFDSSLRQIFDEQCAAARAAAPEPASLTVQSVYANNALLEYLRTVEGYTDWRMMPSQPAFNINTNFGQHPEYGEKLGFIDGGRIFRRGKVGILFFQGGIAVRASSDSSDVSLSYEDICRAIIRNNTSVKDGTVSIRSDRTAVIEATGHTYARLCGVRSALLNSSEAAQSVFASRYRGLISNISSNVENGDLNEAGAAAPLLCEFAGADPRYPVPVSIDVSVLMLKHLFDEAAALAGMNGLSHWQQTALRKKLEYQQILSRHYFTGARKSYEKGDIAAALGDVRQSVRTTPTVEGWELYIDIVDDFASESNMYLNEDISRIINAGQSASVQQKEALRNKPDRVSSLTGKYRQFISHLREIMIDRILSGDIEFFRANRYNINTYIDSYGMTALSYAALYRRNTMLRELMQLSPNRTVRNIIGHDLFDVCAFSSLSISDYDSFSGNYDTHYQNVKRSAVNNSQQPGNSLTDPRLEQYYRDRVYNAWTPVINNVRTGTARLPEFLADGASAQEYAQHPVYRDALAQRHESFIGEYLRRNTAPKGEFETSAQYAERQRVISAQAEAAFENAAPGLMHAYEDELRERVRVRRLCVELSYIYLFAEFTGNAYLGSYNADAQVFAIRWNDVSSTVAVPLTEAPSFKECFAQSGVPFDVRSVTVDDGRNVTASCTIEFGGKNYPLVLVKKA